MSHIDFISEYCGAPEEPKIIPVTEEEVIEHFKNYIREKCTDPITVVQYYMPEEFEGRIDDSDFWKYICSFLSYDMHFEIYDPGSGKMDEVWDSTYEDMDFKTFYAVYEKPYYDTGLFNQYARYCGIITKVVFRIYKS